MILELQASNANPDRSDRDRHHVLHCLGATVAQALPALTCEVSRPVLIAPERKDVRVMITTTLDKAAVLYAIGPVLSSLGLRLDHLVQVPEPDPAHPAQPYGCQAHAFGESMKDDTGTYVIDLGHPKNAAIRDTAPGATVTVLVRREDDPAMQPIAAEGHRSQDGHTLTVTVDRGAEPRTHSWSWGALQDAIRIAQRRRRRAT